MEETYKFSHTSYGWKLSKKNQLVKKLRETYVRKDISCGFACCQYKLYDSFIIFTIPTKSVLEKYRSLLKSEFIKPIICQSEYEQMKFSDKRRIREIISKNSYVYFYDTFCEFTVKKGLPGVLEFYQSHLPENKFIILDENNIKEYSKYFDNADLVDLVQDVHITEETEYEEYYDNVEYLYNEGKVFRSTLIVDNYNWRNGTVYCQDNVIRILGRKNMNRATHGDEVYVELIDKVEDDKIENVEKTRMCDKCNKGSTDNNGCIGKKCHTVDSTRSINNEDVMNEQKEANKNMADEKLSKDEHENDKLYGKIVGIHKKCKTELIGTILNDTVNGDGSQNVLVLPMKKNFPPLRIRTSQVEELVNKRLFLELEFWEKDSKYPIGRYFKRLGKMGDLEDEIKSILISNNINYYDTKWIDLIESTGYHNLETKKALKNEYSEFYSFKAILKEIEDGHRVDLRHLDIFSIDPEGCTDVDDALHIRVLPNNNYEVGVHIADVSHYVKPKTSLDLISCDRATTVYLPHKRIDMLPEFLSAGICSLLENEERGTFSVIWELDENANVLKTEFKKAFIKSRKAFSYEQAANLINSKEDGFLKPELLLLKKISSNLRKKREENGALDMSTKKVEIKNEKIVIKDFIETNILIEEYMLLANISVADYIYKHYPENALLRKHPLPSKSEMPIEINLQSSKDVNRVLKSLEPEKCEVMKKILIKSMNQATYVLSSQDTSFNHFGLAVPYYTHFTSPIRRYADILVHRTLHCLLTSKETSKQSSQDTCKNKRVKVDTNSSTNDLYNLNDDTIRNINNRNSSSRKCAWDINTLFIYKIVSKLEPETTAYVTNIKSNGVLIHIPDYDINESLVVEENKYSVFDRIKVKIERDDDLFYLKRRFKITIL